MLVTFGLLFVIEDIVRTIWGKDYLTVSPPPILSGVGADVRRDVPGLPAVRDRGGAGGSRGLSLWLRLSRIGLYVRASSVDPITTGMQGVDTDRVSALVVAIGTGLAGLSGTIAGPLLALSPSMGGFIIIDCFVVVVAGGLTSFTGVFLCRDADRPGAQPRGSYSFPSWPR